MRGGQHSETIGDLEDALAAGDFPAARRVCAVPRDQGVLDEVLSLLARHAPWSPEALELLIEVLDASGVVRRFAGAALVDRGAVDDVSQDALISVAESIRSYDGRGRVTSWVYAIVRRRVVDHLRRERDTAPLREETGPTARISSMIATRTTVREVLAALPGTYRDPVTLRDIEGLSYAEIAARLGRPEGTVRSQVTRGRALVGARLSDEGRREGDSR